MTASNETRTAGSTTGAGAPAPSDGHSLSVGPVKYHFHTNQGMRFLSNPEAAEIAGRDADFHRRDLFEAITRRDFPRQYWKNVDAATGGGA